jgi:hypothetical protein
MGGKCEFAAGAKDPWPCGESGLFTIAAPQKHEPIRRWPCNGQRETITSRTFWSNVYPHPDQNTGYGVLQGNGRGEDLDAGSASVGSIAGLLVRGRSPAQRAANPAV